MSLPAGWHTFEKWKQRRQGQWKSDAEFGRWFWWVCLCASRIGSLVFFVERVKSTGCHFLFYFFVPRFLSFPVEWSHNNRWRRLTESIVLLAAKHFNHWRGSLICWEAGGNKNKCDKLQSASGCIYVPFIWKINSSMVQKYLYTIQIFIKNIFHHSGIL